MDFYQPNTFLFSAKWRVWRHIAFWVIQTLLVACAWATAYPFVPSMIVGIIWLPVYIVYCYPFVYWVIPRFLLSGRFVQFAVLVLLWVVAAWFINYYFRLYIMFPAREAMGFRAIGRNPGQQGNFFSLIAVWCFVSTMALFTHWLKKQQEWLQAEKAKVTAELQLLKAQVHPHFLFNTLNNIYSFSLEASPKTPGLILKLSSLLSYMLYECKEDQVLLQKELEVMKDYVDLEKERYGNKIEVSWNVEGDVADKYIAPLLLLPFLENAFKHGTSEQLEKPWLSFDLEIRQNVLKCKVVNSKNECTRFNKTGIGIANVKRRLHHLYPRNHELKIHDESEFFVVSLWLQLTNTKEQPAGLGIISPVVEKAAV